MQSFCISMLKIPERRFPARREGKMMFRIKAASAFLSKECGVGYTAQPMTSKKRLGILFALVAVSYSVPCLGQTAKGNGYAAYSTAAKDPKAAQAPSFAAVLLGGHGDVDEATDFLCKHSGGGELVVLSASGADE